MCVQITRRHTGTHVTCLGMRQTRLILEASRGESVRASGRKVEKISPLLAHSHFRCYSLMTRLHLTCTHSRLLPAHPLLADSKQQHLSVINRSLRKRERERERKRKKKKTVSRSSSHACVTYAHVPKQLSRCVRPLQKPHCCASVGLRCASVWKARATRLRAELCARADARSLSV